MPEPSPDFLQSSSFGTIAADTCANKSADASDYVDPAFKDWLDRAFAGRTVSSSVRKISSYRPFENLSKRQRDFLVGRECARDSMRALMRTGHVGVASDRSPIWPKGLVGSISHSEDLAWCVVGDESEFESIGIDTEKITDSSTAKTLRAEIGADWEWRLGRDWLNNSRSMITEEMLFTLVFSAKESFYKCWYPRPPGLFWIH